MKINTPRYRVVYSLDGDPANYAEVEVQAIQADTIRYDMMRARHGWPGIQDAPILWSTVVAWAALIRTGVQLSRKFDEAIEQIIAVETLTVDGSPVDEDTTEDDLPGAHPTPATA